MESPVVHIVLYPQHTGHVTNRCVERAADCWCEPTYVRWLRDDRGIMVLVVEHSDAPPIEDAWVDRALADPPALPPHEGDTT